MTNATPGKNEITIEFHQNDDAAVSLMEVRFYIPPSSNTDPDNEKDAVAVSICINNYILAFACQELLKLAPFHP